MQTNILQQLKVWRQCRCLTRIGRFVPQKFLGTALHIHPVFALCKQIIRDHIERIKRWYNQLRTYVSLVLFATPFRHRPSRRVPSWSISNSSPLRARKLSRHRPITNSAARSPTWYKRSPWERYKNYTRDVSLPHSTRSHASTPSARWRCRRAVGSGVWRTRLLD